MTGMHGEMLEKEGARERKMPLKKLTPYLGILAVGISFGGFIFYKHTVDLEQIKSSYITEKQKDTDAVAAKVEDTFKAFYQGLRTISLLPGVKEIDRYGKSFDINSKKAVQQLYNSTFLNVNLSEVYILPKALDPDQLDPATGKPEGPIVTFDQFIVAESSNQEEQISPENAASETKKDEEKEKIEPNFPRDTNKESENLEVEEIFEYRLMKKQLAYLSLNYPNDQSFDKLNIPAITGEPVITCDNSEFTKKDIQSGDNSQRMGIVLTLPIYGNDRNFRGAVSGVIRTNILEKLIPKGSYALVNSQNNYRGITDPIPEFNQALKSFKNGNSDPDLIYSEVRKLRIIDNTTWELWVAMPRKDYLSRTAVKQANLIFWSGLCVTFLVMFGMGSFVRYSQRYQGTLEAKVEEKTKGLQESNQAIKTILDHVSFGLLICDSELRVRSGYSASCNQLLDRQERIDGKNFASLLNLSVRSAEHFQAVYSQIFDPDLMIGDLSVSYLPTRFHINSKTLGVTGSVIHDAAGKPVAVLFCLSDVTSLANAEEEIEKNRCMLNIVSNRDSFRQFVADVREGFSNIYSELNKKDADKRLVMVKREIHTLKGNFASYGLNHISKLMHELEDQAEIGLDSVKIIEQRFVAFLDQNQGILGVGYHKDPEDAYIIPEHLVSQAEDKAQKTSKHEHLKEILLNFFKSIRLKTVKTHLGPVEENFTQLAERLGKKARLEIIGNDILVPSEHAGIFKVITHLIRNALDHGLEHPYARGQKPEVGSVRLAISKDDTVMTIEIRDDGKGLNRDKIIKAATAKKITTNEKAQALPDGDVFQLIFEGGLSTAEEVSEVSGRGIGLEAVKKAVQDSGGDISIRSRMGEGTTFLITLPLIPQAQKHSLQISRA